MKSRVAKLEKQMRERKPEMKLVGFHGTPTIDPFDPVDPKELRSYNCASIFQGEGVSQRVGNQIRIHRVIVRAAVPAGVDAFLMLAKDGTVLVADDFVNIQNTFVRADILGPQVELRHHYVTTTGGTQEYSGDTSFEWDYRPKGGLLVNFEGDTTLGMSPNIYFYVLNKTGTSKTFRYAWKTYYTDC